MSRFMVSLHMELVTDLLGINIGCTLDTEDRVILVGFTVDRLVRLLSSFSSLLRSNMRLLLSSESARINCRASLAGLDSSAYNQI